LQVIYPPVNSLQVYLKEFLVCKKFTLISGGDCVNSILQGFCFLCNMLDTVFDCYSLLDYRAECPYQISEHPLLKMWASCSNHRCAISTGVTSRRSTVSMSGRNPFSALDKNGTRPCLCYDRLHLALTLQYLQMPCYLIREHLGEGGIHPLARDRWSSVLNEIKRWGMNYFLADWHHVYITATVARFVQSNQHSFPWLPKSSLYWPGH